MTVAKIWLQIVAKSLPLLRVLNYYSRMNLADKQVAYEQRRFRMALNETFVRRREKNASYSLRAFARSLDLDPTLLSRLMKGERKISKAMAQHLACELDLPLATESFAAAPAPRQLSDGDLARLSKWYFFAILDLFRLKDFRSDIEWMHRRLPISKSELVAALKILEDLGYIDRSSPNWKSNVKATSWAAGQSSRVRRNYQKQILELALNTIDRIDIDARENSSLTLPIHSDLLPEIKRRVQEFKDDLKRLAAERGEFNEIYQVAIAAFPLTKKET